MAKTTNCYDIWDIGSNPIKLYVCRIIGNIRLSQLEDGGSIPSSSTTLTTY
jgi:hypothetical protein